MSGTAVKTGLGWVRKDSICLSLNDSVKLNELFIFSKNIENKINSDLPARKGWGRDDQGVARNFFTRIKQVMISSSSNTMLK